MSNLRDLIRLEIERGQLAEPFRVSDLRALVDRNRGLLGGVAAPEHLNSYLANHSTGPGGRVGEAVKRGGARLFIKHEGRATYSLNHSDYEADFEEDTGIGGELETTTPPAQPGNLRKKTRKASSARPAKATERKAITKDEIAEKFVEYLREKPFRLLRTDRGTLRWEPASGPVCGWAKRVDEYRWNGSDWKTTSAKIAQFVSDLEQLESNRGQSGAAEEAERIFKEIKKWGNPNRGQYLKGDAVLRVLTPLWGSGSIREVDSTLTKLYAFARPDSYVIYDSRVATATMTIAEDIYRPKSVGKRTVNTVEYFRRLYPHLGLYNGSGGTRQRGYRTSSGWPPAYGVVKAQLDANDLCMHIRDHLNAIKEDGKSDWTLREVEAVLFMEGY